MDINVGILEVVFKLILFGLLSFLFYNIFKTYILPTLQSQIENIKQHTKDLLNKINLLKSTKNRIIKEIAKQDQDLAKLNAKIQLWQKTLLEKETLQQKKQQLINSKIIERKKKQGHQIYLTKIKISLVPELINQAHETLALQYEGTNGADLLRNVIKKLDIQ